jgi:hypothetical protein
MKRWFANYLLRLAFRIFRRYHDQLPSEVTKEGIIWGEIRRKPKKDYFTIHHPSMFDPNCSTCVRELEEDRARQETVKRWLKGEMR